MKHDISVLEAKLKRLDDSLTKIVKERHVEELIPIIKRPGWTTPAEFAFAVALVDALQHQVDGLGRLQQNLVGAARQVAQG
jgi:hypothetical protein